MREDRYNLFHALKQKSDRVYLYFIHQYAYKRGELRVEHQPYIKVDDDIKALFNSIDKNNILEQLSEKYRRNWENSYDQVKLIIQHGGDLKLNRAAQVLFGPYFRPNKVAQNYNVYTTFHFSLEEVKDLVNPSELYRFDKTIIDKKIFYTIDAIAKAFELSEGNAEYSEELKYRSTKGNDGFEKKQESNVVKERNENGEYNDKFTEKIINEIGEHLRIKELSISNFVNLDVIKELKFSPAINLFIGKNSTGKTSLLKLLYAVVKSLEEYIKQKKLYNRPYKDILNTKCQEVFQSTLSRMSAMVSHGAAKQLTAQVDLGFVNDEEDVEVKEAIHFLIDKDVRGIGEIEISELFLSEDQEQLEDFNAIFVPAKEILSIAEAVKKSFKEYVKGFDATYYDLADMVGPYIEFAGLTSEFRKMVAHIQNHIIDGKIEYDDVAKEFMYIDNKGGRYEMTMTAEGIKQLGVIPMLIQRGLLHSGSILFLDEPDNNLNPVAIGQLVDVVTELAKAGVQVFISSHNYFIIKRLHINARKNKQMKFKAFSLIDDPHGEKKVEIEEKDLKMGLPKYNPIVDEAMKMFQDDLQADLGL